MKETFLGNIRGKDGVDGKTPIISLDKNGNLYVYYATKIIETDEMNMIENIIDGANDGLIIGDEKITEVENLIGE
ncbi:MAG: hypothetical protein K1X33_05115 [Methanobacteriaceae archaeon]|nr:hypothetical protein [Methanobacteriaceae archaeon]